MTILILRIQSKGEGCNTKVISLPDLEKRKHTSGQPYDKMLATDVRDHLFSTEIKFFEKRTSTTSRYVHVCCATEEKKRQFPENSGSVLNR